MKAQNMDRAQKIALLKKVISGELSVSDFRAASGVSVWWHNTNGTITNNNQVKTPAELEAFAAKSKLANGTLIEVKYKRKPNNLQPVVQ